MSSGGERRTQNDLDKFILNDETLFRIKLSQFTQAIAGTLNN